MTKAAPPTLHPPDANSPQRQRGNERPRDRLSDTCRGRSLVRRDGGRGARGDASFPARGRRHTSHSDEQGYGGGPSREQSRSGATATSGKIGRTRPSTGNETASADPTAPPLTRAWPAGLGAAAEISGEDLLVALRAAGLNLRRISARDGGLDDSLRRGEVNGAHLPTEEMAAVRQVLQQETLLAALAVRAAPTRALGRLCAGSGPSPPWRGRARLTWARPKGPRPPPTQTQPCRLCDESSMDSNGDSSADAEGSVWPEDGKGYALSVDNILAVRDDSSDGDSSS